ncbi:MAG: ubiquitin-specific protease doa4 [Piccolia ochrophora]|nr:MAG: ubiquitin-specific protease doa4 [Piccolia ochrophora]
MSAAAPWRPAPDRHLHKGTKDASGYVPAGSNRNMGDYTPKGLTRPGSGRELPHFLDLVARASPQLDIHAPMRTLLTKADGAAKQADTHLNFNRPDLAYIDYLLASNIVVDYIPRHKDFPHLQSDRGDLSRLYGTLQRRIKTQHQTFDRVREQIKANNALTGVQPTLTAGGSHGSPNRLAGDHPHCRPQTPHQAHESDTLSQPRSVGSTEYKERPSSAPRSAPSRSSWNAPQGRLSPSFASGSPRARPPVQPKPETLQSKPLPADIQGLQRRSSPSTNDSLAERFARLRQVEPREELPQQRSDLRNGAASVPRRSFSSSPNERRESMGGHSPIQLTPDSSTTSLSGSAETPYALASKISTRPSGPRDMPQVPVGPPVPPKHRLDTHINTSMPRPPSPTYSPARNLPTPSTINPPRTTARSVVGTGGRNNVQSGSNGPPYLLSPDEGLPLQPVGPGEHYAQNGGQPLLANLAGRTTISADQLYHCLSEPSRRPSVLVIDVRDREEFDRGHVASTSIMCIEPIMLRPRMSAEEIEETLVLSPEREQKLFSERNRFDLVVCYDLDSVDCLPRKAMHETADGSLLSLSQALQDFNYSKPLQRPPVRLLGGIEAWIKLFSEDALITSETALLDGRDLKHSGQRSGRPIARVPMANTTPGLEAKRKLRDHEPLDIDEEQAWMQRVRGEGRPALSTSDRTISGSRSSISEGSGATEEVEKTFRRDYDDFFRRFPEPAEVQQSMVSPPSTRARRDTILDHPFHNFTDVQTPAPPPRSLPAISHPPLHSAPSRPAPALPRQSYGGVSERTQYQPAPPARAPPIAPSRSMPSDTISSRSDTQIGRTGLTNFGATCYMNAVTQCLSATSPLTRHFLDGSYKSRIQKGNKWGSKGVLPEVYYNLMWHLWNGNFTFISPKTFRDFVSRLNKDFEDPHVQHDANDFLIFILDALHEDFNVNYSRTRLNDLTPAEERNRESMPPPIASRIEWDRYSHRNASRISELFGGQHVSRLECPACHFRSSSYETFNVLQLEIPKKGRGNLSECLRNYTQEEQLSEDDKWICPNCKVPRKAFKKITFTRAPHVLVIQLKRFKSLRRGFTDKITTFIDFPLTGLDLTPYTVRPLDPHVAHDAEAKYGSAVTELLHETTPPFQYDAYAVVQHFGTLTGGHYKALIRGDGARGRWLEFNDKIVSDYDPKHVASPASYLLFYVRSNVQ